MPAWMAVTTNKYRYRFEQRYLGLPVILIHEIKWGNILIKEKLRLINKIKYLRCNRNKKSRGI